MTILFGLFLFAGSFLGMLAFVVVVGLREKISAVEDRCDAFARSLDVERTRGRALSQELQQLKDKAAFPSPVAPATSPEPTHLPAPTPVPVPVPDKPAPQTALGKAYTIEKQKSTAPVEKKTAPAPVMPKVPAPSKVTPPTITPTPKPTPPPKSTATSVPPRVPAVIIVPSPAKKPPSLPVILADVAGNALPGTTPPEPTSEVIAAETKREAWRSFEEAVGKRWMTWLGATILFFSAAFFVKYAIDENILTQEHLFLLECAAGIAAIGLGLNRLQKNMRALGQGCVGCGLMVLYVTLFAHFDLGTVSQPIAFGLLCLVSATGILLAVKHDAIAIAFLAMLGGFLTPPLMSTGGGNRDILFTYTLMLDLGVLAAAWFRKWRALDILAFLGTAVLFGGWYYKAAPILQHAPGTALWLGIFYAVFLLLPFLNHLRTKTEIPLERFLLALANATFGFTFAWYILDEGYPQSQSLLALIALVMSAAYQTLGMFTRKRIPHDTRAVFGFTALAVMFFTLAPALGLGLDGVTFVWAIEGSVLLYLGYRYRYLPVRLGAVIVAGLAFGRIFLYHWSGHTAPYRLFLNHEFGMHLLAPITLAAFAVIHYYWRDLAHTADRVIMRFAAFTTGLLVLAITQVELTSWYPLERPPPDAFTRFCGYVFLWAAGAGAYLLGGWRSRLDGFIRTGCIPLGIAALLVCLLYTTTAPLGMTLMLNPRFAAALMVFLLLLAYARVTNTNQPGHPAGSIAGYLGILLLHVELVQWADPGALIATDIFQLRCALSLLWSAGCATLLGVSIVRHPPESGLKWTSALPWCIGAGYAVSLYLHDLFGGSFVVAAPLFLNARFAVALLPCLLLLVYAWTTTDGKGGKTAAVLTGYLTLILCHGEISLGLGGGILFGGDYTSRLALAGLWTVGSLVFLGVGMWLNRASLRWAGSVPWGIAAFILAFVFLFGSLPGGTKLILNARFLVALLTCLTVFLYGYCARSERLKWSAFILGGLLALVLNHLEITSWFSIRGTGNEIIATCVLNVLWVVGAFVFLFTGLKQRNAHMRNAGFVPLSIAILLAAELYTLNVTGAWFLFMNPRFLGCGLTLGAVMIFAYVLNRCRLPQVDTAHADTTNNERGGITASHLLYAFGFVGSLVLLSIETYSFSLRSGGAAAHRMAQMSLSMVWSVYAAGLLMGGFWKRTRGLRLIALGLFAVTGVKLIFIDFAHLEGLPRILSFAVLGGLMMGASYLYHRLEQRLGEDEMNDANQKATKDGI